MEPTVQFPDPRKADDEGLVAVGGELSTDFLLSAYMQGIFPWFSDENPFLWWSPNPRLLLFPNDFKVSKSLKQLLRSNKYELCIDTSFDQVIEQCSKVPRPGQDGTWITLEMIDAYKELHQMGYVHSFETFLNGKLVGGLYGVSIGKVFCGESMFFHERDASKFALFHLVEFCKNHDFHFIDAQQPTDHMKSLGAVELERGEFLNLLKKALEKDTMVGKWKQINQSAH